MRPIVSTKSAMFYKCPRVGRCRVFREFCDISGPLGDLAGRGSQRSGKVDIGGLTTGILDWNR